jgi:cardiolipin synthase A/B
MEAMFTAITRAKKNVYIETPYFIPTECLLQAIQTASMSGIDVRLVMPKRSDNDFVQYASNSYVEKLLRNKVRVYQYVNGFTHSKLMIVDDELVVVGSANMDIRSLELLFETNLFIYDKKVAQTVRDIYHTDMNNSKELNLRDWLQRNRSVKFREACFRLFSPVY